ncbi:class C beta-lactamase [Stutzerimonas xanthomarina]|uniref:Beta-lactamase n=2 Tax=Stutzerimonas xanthomarina TaxID=271420 RepID=A0A1M5MWK0_9GAMM|nr:class C beta-lactamase [Stutzerimonas xanthomarina]MCP9337699.1 beta-lactamase [Stutzerimonas xanthomarina]SEH85802.1 beta-lactamase class C [Stutzerimonas xanthomarina]SHG81143.1 beta-lactamase class C [Stutzerimonas xanthomarina DSM 18231]
MYPTPKIQTRLVAAAVLATLSCDVVASGGIEKLDRTVDASAKAVMAEHGIHGMAVAITAQGQQRFFDFGVASKKTGQPVTRNTLFEVGSISKTFTVTLAAYAQAQGKLSLNDSPSRYLPELDSDELEQISLINLATHTAGGFPLQLPDHIQTELKLTQFFNDWQPQHATGTYRTYANPSIGLLGRAAAKTLGLPFVDALQFHLLPKLGMTDTYIAVPPEQMTRYAQGYNKTGEPVRLNAALLADEAYGVKTTSKDLLRFVDAQLGTIATDATIKNAMAATQTGYYRVGAMTQALVWEQYPYPAKLDDLLAGNGSHMVLESQPVESLTPPQAPQQSAWINKTGSTNGFGAYVAFVPAKQIGIVILANRYYPTEERVKLAYQILQQLD